MSKDIDNFNNNIEPLQKRGLSYHFFFTEELVFEKKRCIIIGCYLSIELITVPKYLKQTDNVKCLIDYNSVRVYTKLGTFKNFIFDMHRPNWLPVSITKYEFDWLLEFFKVNQIEFELIKKPI